MRLSYSAWVMLTMARGLDGLSRRQGARSRRRVCRESVANWAAQRPHEADFGTPLPSSYAGIRLFCYVNDELHTTISTQARFFKTRMGLGSLALRACMFTRFYKNAISIMCSLQYFLSTLVSGRVRAWPCVRAAGVACAFRRCSGDSPHEERTHAPVSEHVSDVEMKREALRGLALCACGPCPWQFGRLASRAIVGRAAWPPWCLWLDGGGGLVVTWCEECWCVVNADRVNGKEPH